ncbi:uncharacterized protein LOC110036960 [Phalaenopsis equestris]|uniref:uncharacterized protein LOC110036960 n=1 Tax=Phalaenopsis equestris TaxID=78828 RepID=UPI0009E31315|nr:uncharacterized protein LOC110036960 [Phalaenopsis equestris]
MGLFEVVRCGCLQVDFTDSRPFASATQEERRQRKTSGRVSTTTWKPSLVSIPESSKLAVRQAKTSPCGKVAKNMENAGKVRTDKASPCAKKNNSYKLMRDIFYAYGTTAFGF